MSICSATRLISISLTVSVGAILFRKLSMYLPKYLGLIFLAATKKYGLHKCIPNRCSSWQLTGRTCFRLHQNVTVNILPLGNYRFIPIYL